MSYLSKSDYKTAHDCFSKLYYKKKEYPSTNDSNEYLQFLAQGGYMVGKLATLYYPEGIDISTGKNHNLAVELTEKYLNEDNVTLFEGSILSKGKLIRIDILKKENKTLHLIEVKSKSYDPEDNLDNNDYEDYLYDVGFQYLVLKEKYPDYKIIPYLFMPDKSKTTSIEGLAFLFDIKENKTDSKFRSYSITVPAERIEDLVNYNILTLVNVEEYILKLLPEIEHEVNILLPSLEGVITKISAPLGKKCFKCEYSITENQPSNGFEECWKDMPKPKFHLKDLTRAASQSKSVKEMDSLIRQKKVSFDDIESLLGEGTGDKRRKIQIEYTKKNEEYIVPQLKIELESFKYPLHFIDFETSRTALPYHKGMRPYEQVTFQWSCHTIKTPGDEPAHGEWLNLETDFPNFKFAEELMDYMNHNGGIGTPLMWSPYENTVLRDVYIQMINYGYDNPELKKWLETIVKFRKRKDEDPLVPDYLCETEGRFVDLNALANQFYFHPLMKGKTSIKWVLPAVLSSINSERIKNWLKNFSHGYNLYEEDENGMPKDPYDLLKPLEIYEEAERLAEASDDEVHVYEGTGAMRAYEDLMIGLNKGNEEIKQKYKEALLRYCKLDTLAMVIIWEYWGNVSLGEINE
jgi:hypothetical protein